MAIKQRPRAAKKAAPPRRRRLRLIPVTVTMLTLLLIIKTNELYFDSRKLRELYAVRDAVAEEKKEAAKDEKKEEKKDEKKEAKKDEKKEAKKDEDAVPVEKPDEEKEAAKDEKKDEKKPDEKPAGDAKEAKEEKKGDGHGEKKDDGHGGGKPVEEERTHGTGKSTVKEIDAQKAKFETPLYSKTEIDLLQNLSKRREDLDVRERELALKSQILEAAEKRVGDRVNEMKTLEMEMKKTLATYQEKQGDQLKSLVKIYENMKPDEAAAIFNEMEMPILLDVIGKMSERKVAPVLANMDPKKAKDVTQELAEKRKKASAMSAGGAAVAR